MFSLILGIGTDIVEIGRIAAACDRHSERFLARVLSVEEQATANTYSGHRRAEYVAGRFAAKEAIAKAAGCGIARLHMPGVTIAVTQSGLRVTFAGAVAREVTRHRWHVSISHTAEIAYAVAVCEASKGRPDE